MILKGSQRGGARQLIIHLNNVDDNEHVELHEVRGFIGNTLEEALMESYAVSKGTNCAQHMFSLSLSPPRSEDVPVSVFEDTLERIEASIGLIGQPRVVVFHEKEGRRHAHCVWSRIDVETMTAVNLSFFKKKLKQISRELFIQQNWKMPKGLMNSKERNSNQFTLNEMHQSKRTKRDPNELKSMFQECWAISDTQQSFENALKEQGFLLARGDRRNYVAVGFQGEVYSLSRMTGVKTKELEERLCDSTQLPDVETRRAEITREYKNVTDKNIKAALKNKEGQQKILEIKRKEMLARHKQERRKLRIAQNQRLTLERQARADKFARGLRGIFERLSGRHAQLVKEAKREDKKSLRRDLKEYQSFIAEQLKERRRLQIFIQSHRKQSFEAVNSSYLLSSRQEAQDSELVRKIRNKPELILSGLTEKNSVFTKRDITKELDAYFPSDAEKYEAMERILSSNELVSLKANNKQNQRHSYYSTKEMISLEESLLNTSVDLARSNNFRTSRKYIRAAIEKENQALQKLAGVYLSEEQKEAINHITGPEQISCVIGVAGAGKSTMLAAAHQAWESAGHRVLGAALAGKAAKELEQSSGIKSRTLASYEFAWDKSSHELQKGDILIIDEAGMISSKQMARFVNEAKVKGAKICLIGDPQQLQPINAGAPFRNISDEIGYAALHEVHRQKSDWQRKASMAFAKGEVKTALKAYRDHNAIGLYKNNDDAILNLAHDYMNDFISNGEKTTRLALAHRRADVKALNETIREMRKACDELQDEKSYKTEHGRKAFAAGDRLLFTKNDKELGVKNGSLGTVIKTKKNMLTIALDNKKKSESPLKVIVHMNDYNSVTHGYAQTIHKSQGSTVDNSYILASRTLDRQLSYVSFTRHRQNVKLYVDREEFKNIDNLYKIMGSNRQKQSTIDFEKQCNIENTVENTYEVKMKP